MGEARIRKGVHKETVVLVHMRDHRSLDDAAGSGNRELPGIFKKHLQQAASSNLSLLSC